MKPRLLATRRFETEIRAGIEVDGQRMLVAIDPASVPGSASLTDDEIVRRGLVAMFGIEWQQWETK